jgi:hypothetical protein
MDQIRIKPTDAAQIMEVLQVGEDGFVSVPSTQVLAQRGGPLDMQRIGEAFKKSLGSNPGQGNLYASLRNVSRRVTKNAIRPEGSSPVRGSGMLKFGPPIGLSSEVAEKEKDAKKLEDRRDKIRKDQLSNREAMVSYMDTFRDDERLACIADCEMHQITTGGGYDNTTPEEYFAQAVKFCVTAETLPPVDADMRAAVVDACLELRDQLIADGMRLNSLKPTPFVKVRTDQAINSTDGVMGFPFLKHGKDPFTEKECRAVKSVYQVDLSWMLAGDIDDGYGYKGPARCMDAVGQLLSEVNYDLNQMLPFYVGFQRIQRHGWKELAEDGVVAKDGKVRLVSVPDVVWGGGVGAMVGDAWQKEVEEKQVKCFCGYFEPEKQAEVIFEMCKTAAENDCIVLSTDESQYDASLKADILATIFNLVVKPFFEEAYHPLVDMTAISLICKVMVVDAEGYHSVKDVAGSDELIKMEVKDWVLVFVAGGGMPSGHKMTSQGDSLYGMVTVVKAPRRLMNCRLPREITHDGCMLGDDCLKVERRDAYDTTNEETVYGQLSEVLARFGITVNPAKQLWVVYGDEPVAQFLQKIYHFALNIKAVGSASRVLQQVDFSENSPVNLTTEEQAVAQISVMQNGYNNPFIGKAIEIWLSSDPGLTYLFQTLGLSAWDYLIGKVSPDNVKSVLHLETRGGNSTPQSATEVSNNISLEIVKVIADTAAGMPPSQKSWVTQSEAINSLKQNDSGEADDEEAVDDSGNEVEEV